MKRFLLIVMSFLLFIPTGVFALPTEEINNEEIKSNVNTLKSLVIEDCDDCRLSPSFKSNLLVYILTTTDDSIKIVATPLDKKATVSGTGEKTLNKSKETIEIVVTSESGEEKKYQLIVTKEDPISSDNTLKSLSLKEGNLTPVFSSDVTSYELNLDKEEVEIFAEVNNAKAKISGTGKKKLNYGKNEFNIVVTAENGTSKNYLITINRPDNRNANAYLKELIIDGNEIGFEKDIVDYTYKVSFDVEKLNISAIPEHETSVVEISGNDELVVGSNEILIKVKAEDESVKEYKINVTREEKVINTKLKELEIKGFDINFEQDVFEYNVVITDQESLEIEAIAEDENNNVEISGNSNLKDGSIIKVIVSNDDGSSTIYKIKIQVNKNISQENVSDNSNNINYIPIIMISLLVLLSLLNIIQIIKKSRKK